MDMKVSGSGSIPGGEYENVRISGSGKCHGNIKCISFHASGSAHCASSVECTEGFHVSGSGHVEGDVKAGNFHCSGSAHIDGGVEVQTELRASGSCHVGKNCISHGKLRASGSLSVEGEIEAETAHISGVLRCKGLLNAEEVQMTLGRRNSSRVGAIGGSRIVVEYGADSGNVIRLFGFQLGKLSSSREGIILQVEESIEGDEMTLEGVETPLVVGKNIRIGDGCRIGTVRYSGVLEVSEKATVGNTEKIG